jgi:hypothetical protein
MNHSTSDTDTFRATSRGILREVNERIRTLADVHEVPTAGSPQFVCECGEQACLEIIELSEDEYELVRLGPLLVVVACGHERTDEQVVLQTDRFCIVQGRPSAASAANLEVVMEELRVRVQTIHSELAERADSARATQQPLA